MAAKRWKAGSHGVEPLRALDTARRALDASHCVYITLGEPNDKTRLFASKSGITLVNGMALVQLLGSALSAPAALTRIIAPLARHGTAVRTLHTLVVRASGRNICGAHLYST